MKFKRIFHLSLLLTLILMTSCDLKIREIYTAEDESYRIRYDRNCKVIETSLMSDIFMLGDAQDPDVYVSDEDGERGYIVNKSYSYFGGSTEVSKEAMFFKSLGYLDELGYMRNIAHEDLTTSVEKIHGRNYLIVTSPFKNGGIGAWISAITYKDEKFYQFVYYKKKLSISGNDLFDPEVYKEINEELENDIKKIRLESVGQSWISSAFIGYIHGYFAIVRWPFTWFTERTVYDDWSKVSPGWYKFGFILGIISLVTSFFRRKKDK